MRHTLHGAYGAVTLRPLEREDIEFVRVLRNRNRESFLYSQEISSPAQQQWYDRYLQEPGDYMFAVCLQGRLVGAAAIYQVDCAAGTAEFGRLMIDRKAAGMGGLGLETTRAVCGIALEQLGIHTVVLEVYADNEAAKVTYQRAGFIPVGTACDSTGKKVIQMERNQ